MNWDTNVCPYCGHDYRFVPPQPEKKKSNLPLAGGILVIIAGLAAIVMAITFILIEPSDIERLDYSVIGDSDLTPSDLENILETCGVICIVFGAIAIIGGTFALMRKQFALAVVGGIFGMIGIGYFIGGILGLIGLILIVISKKDFE